MSNRYALPRKPMSEPRSVANWCRLFVEGELALPAWQRPYVWKGETGEAGLELLRSILNLFPIGIITVFNGTSPIVERPIADLGIELNKDINARRTRQYLIDGQQRLTTLAYALYPSEAAPSLYGFNLAEDDFFLYQKPKPKKKKTTIPTHGVLLKDLVTDALDLYRFLGLEEGEFKREYKWYPAAGALRDLDTDTRIEYKDRLEELRDRLVSENGYMLHAMSIEGTEDCALRVFTVMNRSGEVLSELDLTVSHLNRIAADGERTLPPLEAMIYGLSYEVTHMTTKRWEIDEEPSPLSRKLINKLKPKAITAVLRLLIYNITLAQDPDTATTDYQALLRGEMPLPTKDEIYAAMRKTILEMRAAIMLARQNGFLSPLPSFIVLVPLAAILGACSRQQHGVREALSALLFRAVILDSWGHQTDIPPLLASVHQVVNDPAKLVEVINEAEQQAFEEWTLAGTSVMRWKAVRQALMCRNPQVLDWDTGKPLGMESSDVNDKIEWHHFFPRKMDASVLRGQKVRGKAITAQHLDVIGNLYPVHKGSNNIVYSNRAPSEYLTEVAQRVPNLREQLILQGVPVDLLNDDYSLPKSQTAYEKFVTEATRRIERAIREAGTP